MLSKRRNILWGGVAFGMICGCLMSVFAQANESDGCLKLPPLQIEEDASGCGDDSGITEVIYDEGANQVRRRCVRPKKSVKTTETESFELTDTTCDSSVEGEASATHGEMDVVAVAEDAATVDATDDQVTKIPVMGFRLPKPCVPQFCIAKLNLPKLCLPKLTLPKPCLPKPCLPKLCLPKVPFLLMKPVPICCNTSRDTGCDAKTEPLAAQAPVPTPAPAAPEVTSESETSCRVFGKRMVLRKPVVFQHGDGSVQEDDFDEVVLHAEDE